MSTLSAVAASVLPALLVCVGGALALGWAWRRRRPPGSAVADWLGLACSIGLIVAVTLARDGLPRSFSLAALGSWPTDQTRQFLADPLTSDQIVLNVLLFVPAGYFLVRVRRRPVPSWALLTLFSLVLEPAQALLGIGANDVSDVVANAVGAALGVAAASLLGWLRPPSGDLARPGRRHILGWLGAWASVGVLLVGGAQVLAARRAEELRATLDRGFAGSTLADYRQWESRDLVASTVFDIVSPRADGVEQRPDAVLVRYPAAVLGARWCVLVTWDAQGVSTARSRGSDCSRFLG